MAGVVVTLFPKFEMDTACDSATPATLEPEIVQEGQKVAKVAESQPASLCHTEPGQWFGNHYNMIPVGRTVAGVLVTKTYDMAYDSSPEDPTPPTCRECTHLYKEKYCKVIYRRGMRELRHSLAPCLDRPWRCPDFKFRQ